MDATLIVLAIAVLAFVLVVFSRANEVCAIGVRRGATLLVRGRAPQRLFDDLSEVVRRNATERALLRIVKEGGAARMLADGVDERTAQQLRNVLGAYPYRLLVSPPPARGPRNLGQRLGISWLAWYLADRS